MGKQAVKEKNHEEKLPLFQERLFNETEYLHSLFANKAFCHQETKTLGLELEACLINKGFLPAPKNLEFLKNTFSQHLCSELSAFNFEVNTDPYPIHKKSLNQIKEELSNTWQECESAGEKIGVQPLLIGSLPTISRDCISLDNMSKAARYSDLNQRVLSLRDHQPAMIDIKGEKEKLETTFSNVMFVATSTSLQVHIQVNQEEVTRFYNASLLASIPCVAAAANSPFLLGKQLWEESRIAVFEQGIALDSRPYPNGKKVGRVSMGGGFVENSIMDLFWENYRQYAVLLPYLSDEPSEKLKHLSLHNGTIWRWNRPIICTANQRKPSIRMEQRVMAAGPSIVDSVANMAFSIGLTSYLANLEKPPEESISFCEVERDFYEAAKKGIQAKVNWLGKTYRLDRLIVEELIPAAHRALIYEGLSKDCADYYLYDVLLNRIKSGQTGSQWQKDFVNKYGKDFKSMTKCYQEEQEKGIPVYQWKICNSI